MKKISTISEIIPGIIKSLGLGKKSEQVQIMLNWHEIVSAPVFEKTKPIEIKRGVLKVLVESSAWMNELQLMKPEIMAKIENRFGRNRIRDIKFSLGKIVKSNKT